MSLNGCCALDTFLLAPDLDLMDLAPHQQPPRRRCGGFSASEGGLSNRRRNRSHLQKPQYCSGNFRLCVVC